MLRRCAGLGNSPGGQGALAERSGPRPGTFFQVGCRDSAFKSCAGCSTTASVPYFPNLEAPTSACIWRTYLSRCDLQVIRRAAMSGFFWWECQGDS